MLEIPESNTIAEQINQNIAGKTIMNVYANQSPHKFAWFFGDPDAYQTLLCGKVIDKAEAISGMVEISADDCRIVFGDGVNVRYFDVGEKLPAKHQLHIEFEDFSSLTCSVQMYGGMWAFRDGEWNDNPYYLAAKSKPSPLSDAFDRAYFDELFQNAKPTISVKAFAAAEQRIPGLGNGVLQDILFNAKLHPKRKLNSLTDGEISALFHSIKQTLLDMTMHGGRNTEKDLFGCPGGYITKLSAKTKGDPCPVCGGDITREAYMGGNVYYCGGCQGN